MHRTCLINCMVGRILSRLSKDQDTLDNELAMTLWQVRVQISSCLSTILNLFIVPQRVQLSYRNRRACVLYLPIPWNHLLADGHPLLLDRLLLPSVLSGDEAARLTHAIHSLWVTNRYGVHLLIWNCGSRLPSPRNVDWTIDYPSLP